MTTTTSPITIHPVTSSDVYAIAALEADVFSSDPISVYALGPQRATPSALQKRAQSLLLANANANAANTAPSSTATTTTYPPTRMRKAVITTTASAEEGGGQQQQQLVVGFAFWKFFTDLKRNPGASPIDQEEGEEVKRRGVEGGGRSGGGGAEASGEEEEKQQQQQQESKWPEGANVQLCELIFGRSDECCRVSMRGRKYAVLSILVVSPDYQGRGIGTMLIREGLEVVDEMGLPTWLGATDVALPLYRKVGFEVDRVFEFDMLAYGGEGLMNHTLMIRPEEQKKESSEALN